jgi:hypothetical protein
VPPGRPGRPLSALLPFGTVVFFLNSGRELLGFCWDTHFAGTTEYVRLGRQSPTSFIPVEMCELCELCELSPRDRMNSLCVKDVMGGVKSGWLFF